MVAIFLPIDDKLFERLTVAGDAEHRVFVAFVVPVTTRLNRDHALPPRDRLFQRRRGGRGACSELLGRLQKKLGQKQDDIRKIIAGL